jgi:Bacterial Ig domain
MRTQDSTLKLFLGGMAIAFSMAISAVQAQTYWTGTNFTFTNPGNSAADVLTPNVSFARNPAAGSGTGGLYNSANQSSPFIGAAPPAGTEWGFGTLAGYMANHSSVSFGECPLEQGNSPGNLVGTTFVVHLITNNIYLQLTLNAWGGQGGAVPKNFAYTRSTPLVVATPTVSITNPPNNAVFAAPATEKIAASATVSGGTVTNVQFYANNALLGAVSTPPFTFTANNLAAGSYALTAAATAAGISATSSVVNISVVTPVTISLSKATALSSTSFEFTYQDNVGLSYVVQKTATLLQPNWIPIVTNVAASNPTVFVDPHATNNPGYYRVGRLPNP